MPTFPALRHPAIWAVVNLLITLYGILFKGWNLQPIVYIFWIEIILNVASALVRVAASMNRQPFRKTIAQKIGLLLFGAVMGFAFILLTVVFTFNVYSAGVNTSGFENIQGQALLLVVNYIAALAINFFLNGRYRRASPVGELMQTFVYLLILLAFIMVITQHLAPRYAGSGALLWTGLAVVLVKFAVDMAASVFRERLQRAFSEVG